MDHHTVGLSGHHGWVACVMFRCGLHPYGPVVFTTTRRANEAPSDPPIFRDGSLPAPESAARLALIHGVALLALAVTVAYLAWRLTGTISVQWWWVAIPLFVVEVHNAFGLTLYTVALWRVDAQPHATGDRPPRAKVAVLIPTYNEPPDVLLPTIAAAVALKPAHETWVLDDGKREEIRALAETLGAHYLTRPDNKHAKAGNLNHALDHIRADIIGVLDADHVPTARFLTALLPYFHDPQLAFVQSPQDFYNLESFEHQRRWNGQIFNEEAVFYRVIAPAKNRWHAPFWCGTCALVRVEALRSVGGVSTDSVTEDIHTTIRMYRKGWTGAYHNEVVARGLAPDDATSYLIQRNRWALGAMQVLRTENPLFGRGLTGGQRLAFLTTLFGWFDSWRTFAYITIPLAVVATGAVPIDAPGEIFGPFFLATLGIQFIALRLLARGHYPPILSVLFEVLRMPAVLPATLALIWPNRAATFKVTPKGRSASAGHRTPVPRLLTALAAASSIGLVWFTATLFGLTPLRYGIPWAAIGAAGFMAVNLALLLAAIRRIRSSRFAGNRRAGTRLPVRVLARLAGLEGEILDLSVSGARIRLPAPVDADSEELWLTLDLPSTQLELQVDVRRTEMIDGRAVLGLSFRAGQEKTVAALAVAVFHADVSTRRDRRRRGRGLVWEGQAA
jgi:cellulose synthase/poly-beta-1,6-N-acetylglucosamine synthase-like glycosyltransferase